MATVHISLRMLELLLMNLLATLHLAHKVARNIWSAANFLFAEVVNSLWLPTQVDTNDASTDLHVP